MAGSWDTGGWAALSQAENASWSRGQAAVVVSSVPSGHMITAPAAVTPDPLVSPSRHTFSVPRAQGHTLTKRGAPSLSSSSYTVPGLPDPTHLEPTRPSKQGLEPQSRLKLAMEG